MAKKTKRSGRRRIGAVSRRSSAAKGVAMTIAGAVAGAVIKRMASNALAGQTAVNVKPEIVNGVMLIGGGLLAARAKNPFISSMGIGIAAQSGLELAQGFGVLKGIGASGFYLLPKPSAVAGGATFVPSVGQASGGRSNVYNFPGPNSVGRTSSRIRKFAHG